LPGLIDPLPSSSFCNSNLASRYSLAIFGLMTNPYSSATARDHEGSQAALEAAEALGPDHYVIDRHGLQIWSTERKLLRNED
jgi:hypothetical protein